MTIDKRKVGLLAVVYASQGIAPGFAAFAMPVLLRREGVSLQGVGFVGLLLLPVALKFVWGPWSDRLAVRGRTRLWMSGLQTALALCFAGIAVAPPARGLVPFLTLVGAAYLIVAVLDTITDGVAVRLLTAEERPLGNAAQYGGYYGGSILAGGLFLAIEPRLGWAPAVAVLALMVAAGWAAARALPEPAAPVVVAGDGAPRPSVLAFLRSPVALYVLPLLLLLDMPQNIGIALVGPFLFDNGLTQAQVGMVWGTAGLLAALAGAALGGVLLAHLPRVKAIVVAGVLQSLSLFGFAWMATSPGLPLAAAFVVVCTANALASMFNVALSSWFMDQTSPRQPATDYSVMACAHTATFAVAGPIAGWTVGALGFAGYYTAIGAVALVGVLVAVPWLRRPPARGLGGEAVATAAVAGE